MTRTKQEDSDTTEAHTQGHEKQKPSDIALHERDSSSFSGASHPLPLSFSLHSSSEEQTLSSRVSSDDNSNPVAPALAENAVQQETIDCPQCGEDLFHPFQNINRHEELRFCPRCQLPLALVANKYRLEKRLGEGGHGIVFLAKHVHLKLSPLRVIKFLKPEYFMNKTATHRFLREIQTTSSVSQHNQHIVRVFDDFGEIPGLGLFFVMEYLEGDTLESLLQKSPLLPIPQVIEIFYQLCDAIHAAHEGGIVHRDLKPSNIFLVERLNQSTFVKVMDFGIAKMMDSSALHLTKGHETIGTPAYMSPEQFQKEPIDHRTDIYCLGLLLYEMLVGHVPFVPKDGPEPSFLELAHSHLYQIPEQPSSVCPERQIPSPLEHIVGQALAKSPDNRFQSVHDILQILDQLRPQKTPLNLDILRDSAYAVKPSTTSNLPVISLHRHHPFDTLGLAQTRDTSPELQQILSPPVAQSNTDSPVLPGTSWPLETEVSLSNTLERVHPLFAVSEEEQNTLPSSGTEIVRPPLPAVFFQSSSIEDASHVPTLTDDVVLPSPVISPQENDEATQIEIERIHTTPKSSPQAGVGLETIPEISMSPGVQSSEMWDSSFRSPWITVVFWLVGVITLICTLWVLFLVLQR